MKRAHYTSSIVADDDSPMSNAEDTESESSPRSSQEVPSSVMAKRPKLSEQTDVIHVYESQNPEANGEDEIVDIEHLISDQSTIPVVESDDEIGESEIEESETHALQNRTVPSKEMSIRSSIGLQVRNEKNRMAVSRKEKRQQRHSQHPITNNQESSSNNNFDKSSNINNNNIGDILVWENKNYPPLGDFVTRTLIRYRQDPTNNRLYQEHITIPWPAQSGRSQWYEIVPDPDSIDGIRAVIPLSRRPPVEFGIRDVMQLNASNRIDNGFHQYPQQSLQHYNPYDLHQLQSTQQTQQNHQNYQNLQPQQQIWPQHLDRIPPSSLAADSSIPFAMSHPPSTVGTIPTGTLFDLSSSSIVQTPSSILLHPPTVTIPSSLSSSHPPPFNVTNIQWVPSTIPSSPTARKTHSPIVANSTAPQAASPHQLEAQPPSATISCTPIPSAPSPTSTNSNLHSTSNPQSDVSRDAPSTSSPTLRRPPPPPRAVRNIPPSAPSPTPAPAPRSVSNLPTATAMNAHSDPSKSSTIANTSSHSASHPPPSAVKNAPSAPSPTSAPATAPHSTSNLPTGTAMNAPSGPPKPSATANTSSQSASHPPPSAVKNAPSAPSSIPPHAIVKKPATPSTNPTLQSKPHFPSATDRNGTSPSIHSPSLTTTIPNTPPISNPSSSAVLTAPSTHTPTSTLTNSSSVSISRTPSSAVESISTAPSSSIVNINSTPLSASYTPPTTARSTSTASSSTLPIAAVRNPASVPSPSAIITNLAPSPSHIQQAKSSIQNQQDGTHFRPTSLETSLPPPCPQQQHHHHHQPQIQMNPITSSFQIPQSLRNLLMTAPDRVESIINAAALAPSPSNRDPHPLGKLAQNISIATVQNSLGPQQGPTQYSGKPAATEQPPQSVLQHQQQQQHQVQIDAPIPPLRSNSTVRSAPKARNNSNPVRQSDSIIVLDNEDTSRRLPRTIKKETMIHEELSALYHSEVAQAAEDRFRLPSTVSSSMAVEYPYSLTPSKFGDSIESQDSNSCFTPTPGSS